jgi:hypothetical protein
VARGFRLVSDDVLLAAPAAGQIVSLAKSPRLKRGAVELLRAAGLDAGGRVGMLGTRVLPPAELVRRTPVPLPLSAVVFLWREPGGGGPGGAAELEEIGLARALVELSRESNLLRLDPSLELARRLLQGSRLYRLRIGDFAANLAALESVA